MGNLVSLFWNPNLLPVYSRLGMYFCFPPKKKKLYSVFFDRLHLVGSVNFFFLKGHIINIIGFVGHMVSVTLLNFVTQKQPEANKLSSPEVHCYSLMAR